MITQPMYLHNQQTIIKRVGLLISLIKQNLNELDENLIKQLTAASIPTIDAELLVYLVPSGFARAFLKRFHDIDSTEGSFIVSNKTGEDVTFDLWEQNYFAYAYALASEIVSTGYTEQIPKQVFVAICERSAEMSAVNSALNAGVDINKGILAPLVLIHLKAEEVIACQGAN